MTQQAGNVQLRVAWGKSTSGTWCKLNTVNLAGQAFDNGGIYLIWHSGTPSRVVYVGQAAVFRDRLVAHRTDARIQAYADLGLNVTWASVKAAQRDGVEGHLADKWSPLVGERRPLAARIVVNSPWD
jgi:hypothetical protein